MAEKKKTARILAFMLAFVVGITFTFSVSTDEASAATFSTSEKVSHLKVAEKTYNSITIRWDKMSNARGYQIYRASGKNGTYKKIGSTTKTTYTNARILTGKKYFYKVRAYKKNGEKFSYSKFSARVSAVPKLKKVTNLSVSSKTKNSVKLSWKKVPGARGYQVYRATSQSGTYKKIGSTRKSFYTSKNLKSGKNYYYKVRAYRKVNGSYKYGGYSKRLKARTKKSSSHSTGSTVNSGGNKVYITATGDKYHYGGCRYLRSSCYEISLSSAIASGYTPCSVCCR